MKKLLLLLTFSFVLLFSCKKDKAPEDFTEYLEIKDSLKKGWNTFNTYNSLSYVFMPSAFEIAVDLKYQATNYGEYLRGAQFVGGTDWRTPKLRALAHAWDGSYTKVKVNWEDINVIIETATEDEDLVILITPLGKMKYNSKAIFRTGILWNKSGSLKREQNNIYGVFRNKKISVYPVSKPAADYNVNASTPYIAMDLDTICAVSTGKKRSLEDVKKIIAAQKYEYEKKSEKYGPKLSKAYNAITTCLAWNTIYEPVKDRVASTVSRTWNVKRGGYGFFGWDNFFMAYMCALDNKELAYANVIEHLNDMTPEGFIPNNSQGNGRQSFDRSQPPVGGITTLEIYKKYPEKWFLEATFDDLLKWNRWWMEKRLHDSLLCWGSHKSKNPFNDRRYNDRKAAILETGLDDSPMYENTTFDKEKGILELHDVGLNSLYVADCKALAEMADVLGRKKESKELRERASMIAKNMEQLWSEEDGIYYNRKTTDGKFLKRKSPTLFYPLMGEIPSEKRAKRMIEEHLLNTEEFWGEWVLPSIAKNDPAFKEQKYWKGAIWAPLNYLAYFGLTKYDNLKETRSALSEKSLKLFVKEWERMKYVSENYSAITGTGDDPRLKSHRFYTWGALLGIIGFMEEGYMPSTKEKPQP